MVSLEALPPSLLEIILDYHPIALEPLRKRQRQPSETLPTAAQLYVKHLPGLAEDSRVKLFAGHLPAYNLQLSKPSEPADPHLFFLLARAKHISDRPRVVFWFNGGPGCSSLDGALMEIGPLRVHAPKDGPLELVEAPHSWSEYTDVVFSKPVFMRLPVAHAL